MNRDHASLIASTIKERVPMRDAAVLYGLAIPARGHPRCPFHDEKDGSLKLYADGYKCFGCGAHGDVIDYVSRLFGLSPVSAMEKLNTDFGLCLQIGKGDCGKPSAKLRAEAEKRKRLQEKRRANLEAANIMYWQALDRWMLLDRLKSDYEPNDPDKPFDVLWVWAENRLRSALIDLELAETILRNARDEYYGRHHDQRAGG